jgi:hypothetical protein
MTAGMADSYNNPHDSQNAYRDKDVIGQMIVEDHRHLLYMAKS